MMCVTNSVQGIDGSDVDGRVGEQSGCAYDNGDGGKALPTTPTTDGELGDLADLAELMEDSSECMDSESDSEDSDSDTMDCGGDGEGILFATDSQVPRVSRFRRPPCAQTLIIFDWDDTLLPSTFVQEQGLTLAKTCVPTVEQMATFDQAAQSAKLTLRAAKRRGRVVLVTNAERGWVELSCRKFCPALLPALEGLSVFSARSEYEQLGVTSPAEWKFRAFEREIRSSGPIRHIVSIGDAAHERTALLRAAKGFPSSWAKSIKLVERPGVPQLTKQHELLGVCLRQIMQHEGNLDLCFRLN